MIICDGIALATFVTASLPIIEDITIASWNRQCNGSTFFVFHRDDSRLSIPRAFAQIEGESVGKFREVLRFYVGGVVFAGAFHLSCFIMSGFFCDGPFTPIMAEHRDYDSFAA